MFEATAVCRVTTATTVEPVATKHKAYIAFLLLLASLNFLTLTNWWPPLDIK